MPLFFNTFRRKSLTLIKKHQPATTCRGAAQFLLGRNATSCFFRLSSVLFSTSFLANKKGRKPKPPALYDLNKTLLHIALEFVVFFSNAFDLSVYLADLNINLLLLGVECLSLFLKLNDLLVDIACLLTEIQRLAITAFASATVLLISPLIG